MNNRKNITDEQLNQMLASMSAEGSAEQEENLNPPVINLYRLEKERLRREKRNQVVATSIAAAVSLILTTVCIIVSMKIYWNQIEQLISEFCKSEAYKNIERFISIYGSEIKLTVLIILMFLALCYVFSTVLLVKNRDKLLQTHQH